MKKQILLVSGLVASLFLSTGVQARQFFDHDDIPRWAESSINKVEEEGIMTGFGDGTFKPNKKLNRAEALTLLLRMSKVDLKDVSGETDFSDVPAEAWFAPAVKAATDRGWIKGFPNGTFRPGKTLNKAEWATIVSRVFALDEDAPHAGFRDVPSKIWFARPVFALADNGLIREQEKYYWPSKEVTRADAAWIMTKILNMPRLLGTSKTNDFSKNRRIDSRRTAIRPRNFNSYKQGYEIDRKELKVSAIPDGGQVVVRRIDFWEAIGSVRIKNTLDDRSILHSIKFKFKFDKTNIGPVQSFFIKLEGPEEEEIYEKKMSATGDLVFTGLEKTIRTDEEVEYKVYLKPDIEDFFYSRVGKGWVTVAGADGTMVSSFRKTGDGSRNNNLRFAPVGIESRTLRMIEFRP